VAGAGAGCAVEDSSGNAGASLAAYLAAADVPLELFVPRDAPEAKLRQARAHGARVDDGAATRQEAAERALAAAARPGALYASHAYSPYFLAGAATLAFEIWSQLGGRAPDDIVLPAGHGLLLLGLAQGFDALRRGGHGERLPRLHGAQAAACAPLAAAWSGGPAAACGPTQAGGAAVAVPVREQEVLAAVRTSGGSLLAIPEEELAPAQSAAARSGWYIEPTSALAVAALERLRQAGNLGDGVVVVLTGSGLKAD
jgi:threonine synthase